MRVSNFRAGDDAAAVPAARRHGRDRRHRHAPPDAPAAHARRAERLHRRASGGHAIDASARRPTRSPRRGPRPSMAGLDLAKVVSARRALRVDRDRVAARPRLRRSRRRRASTSSPTTSASSATSCACWPSAAAASRWCRRRRPRAEVLALKPDGIFLSNGPGDPEPCDYAIEATRELIDTRHADLRHLPGPPDHGAGLGREDLQDEVRPPRREPPGEGPRQRPRQHHQPEPRLRGRREDAAGQPARRRTSACSTARCRAWRAPTSRRSASRATRRRARAARHRLPVRPLRRADGEGAAECRSAPTSRAS